LFCFFSRDILFILISGIVSRLMTLQLCIDGAFTTLVQGCGLIISSATGSTAFSASAGGSILHPSV
jgi:NAD+ kinase